jgi:sodium-dependent dicarboxylate transporter 2/3/5
LRQSTGLWLAPLLATLVLIMPAAPAFDWQMRVAAALVIAMAVLWMCESFHLSVTALLPLVILPVGGVAKASEVVVSYSSDLIFLFIGGFVLANAFEASGLHRRVSTAILRRCGSSKALTVLALMALTAFVSMWVNNTATAVLMMPVALAVVREFDRHDKRLATAAVLGVAAAASIGGMGTPYGSTPNLLFAASCRDILGKEVGFMQWAAIGVPVVIVFTLLGWRIILAVVNHPAWLDAIQPDTPTSAHHRTHTPKLEPQTTITRQEILVGAVFCFMVLSWVFRVPIDLFGTRFGLALLLPKISDGTIAIAGALLLVCVPTGLRPLRWTFNWEQAGKIPWNTMLLFGGGLAMSEGISQSGLDKFLAGQLGIVAGISLVMLVLLIILACTLLSEVASNTAAAALLLPAAAALAAGTGHDPISLMLPVAFATSLGFMLPAATPPNALALASGHVTVPQLAVVGALLNIVGILLLWAAIVIIGFRAFGTH